MLISSTLLADIKGPIESRQLVFNFMQQLYNSDYFHITYSSVNIISYVKKTTLLYFNFMYTYMICVTRNIYIIGSKDIILYYFLKKISNMVLGTEKKGKVWP